MKHIPTLLALFLCGLTATSCSTYSSASMKRATYNSHTPAGQIIAAKLSQPSKDPLAQIGGYLDGAALAKEALKKNPHDRQALADYNFAVGRIMETVQASGLTPWKSPLSCQGTNGVWLFSLRAEHRQRALGDFRIVPADQYEFKGKLVGERKLKAGLGAPVIAASEGVDFTKVDRFAQGKSIYYGMTAVIDFKGRHCTGLLLDPLSTATVKSDGHSFPLAADFSAPISLALAELKPRKTELQRLFKPGEFEGSARLARLQPYDPKKIPLLVIHGLGDSQATWAPMIESLRADPVFRANYQVWFFSYTTAFPYALTAAELRRQLDEIKARYPDHKPIVVLGHSMGGMIARSLMTDSGMTLWNTFFATPPEQTQLSDETRKLLTGALIFKHRPDVSRVILASASLRGSYMATNFMGRMGSKIIGAPPALEAARAEMAAARKPDADGGKKNRVPNSIEGLNPDNPFLHAVNS
ncbi:MAG: alpha/beta fold hydrolase, partial [Verrucomicrobiaceae bacterium]